MGLKLGCIVPRKTNFEAVFDASKSRFEAVSGSVLASQSFRRHSGEVAVFDCVCRIFACVRFVTDRLLCDTGAEILRNAGQFGLLCLCIFVT